ncbi:MAG: hypothetical protein AAFW83_11655 [Pseudomonadota bacterium]
MNRNSPPRTQTAIRPADSDPNPMFIGWAKAPPVDRRFLLGLLPLGVAGLGGLSYALASQLDDPGAGSWNTGTLHTVTGLYGTRPYPHLLVPDPGKPGGAQTVLVVTEGKCTQVLRTDTPEPYRPVTARGVLIERKDRQMLEVPPLLNDWIEDDTSLPPAFIAAQQKREASPMGAVRVRGTIMDSKCFFGVMRPARGRTHKACASLCIRGGIPPCFWVRDKTGNEQVLLMTMRDGTAMPDDILPLVADPVGVNGTLVRVGDLLHLRADVDDFYRL